MSGLLWAVPVFVLGVNIGLFASGLIWRRMYIRMRVERDAFLQEWREAKQETVATRNRYHWLDMRATIQDVGEPPF